jgi:mercury(II) reductase
MAGSETVRRAATTIGNNGGGFDLAVIGAGSAGFSAAIAGAELGARVALIGKGTIGGTCVNVGCVPSKTLIRAVDALHQARAAARFSGIRGKVRVEDWAALINQKNELVSRLRQTKYADVLPAYNAIAYIEGRARFTEKGLAVEGEALGAEKVIVATGASPAVPSIPGIREVAYLTSTTALDLARLPRSLLVIGGGDIGCELAQMLARAGVRVRIVCRSRLLPAMEPEIGAALAGYFADEGIEVTAGIAYRGIRRTVNGIALVVKKDGIEKTVEAEQVLLATGRRPNTGGMGLDEAGIERLAGGGIRVDERMRTTRGGVYAAGDATGRHMYVYMAAYGAKIAAENALNGDARRYDASAMPGVVFTDPQAASVGLTEAEAGEQGLKVRTATLPLSALPRALAARDTRGLIKLVAAADCGRLLGAHILAPEGADSIQTAAMAIRGGLTVTELAAAIFPYLTTVEGLKLAAQSFDRDVSKLPCCAG